MSVQSIENATLAQYVGDNTRQLHLDKKLGKEHGKRGIPVHNDDHYLFFEEICANARAALQEFDTQINRHITVIEEKVENLEEEQNDRYIKERDDLVSKKQEALADLEQTRGPSSSRMKRARTRAEDAGRAYRKLQAELNRPLRVQIRHLYWPMMLVAFLFEAPLNRLAFEMYFQETAIISWAIAAFVGVIFLVIAHFVGQGARRFPSVKSVVGRIFRALMIASGIVLAFVLMYFVAKVRQAFLLFIEGESAFEGSLGSLLRGQDFSLPGFQELLQVPLSQDGYLFILINFAIFAVAVILSYVRYDPHPDYEHLERQHHRADRELARLTERFERENSKIIREFQEQIANKDRHIDTVGAEIQKLNAEITAAQRARVENTIRVAKRVSMRLKSYQSGNMETRADGNMPDVFKKFEENEIIERVGVGPTGGADYVSARERARTRSE